MSGDSPGHTLHITIRRNADGVVRVAHWKDWAWDDGSDYWWGEGNYSCDCNRAGVFADAGGEQRAVEDKQCGDSGYTILSITQDDDPAVLYQDGDRDATMVTKDVPVPGLLPGFDPIRYITGLTPLRVMSSKELTTMFTDNDKLMADMQGFIAKLNMATRTYPGRTSMFYRGAWIHTDRAPSYDYEGKQLLPESERDALMDMFKRQFPKSPA
jgi:hypothetical protein